MTGLTHYLELYIKMISTSIQSTSQYAIFYLLGKKNFKMIWTISDLSPRDWIWRRITSKYIFTVAAVWTCMIVLFIFLFPRELEEQRKKRKDIEEDGPDDDEVPTRETLMRQSELLVNAKQGPKKGGRRKI